METDSRSNEAQQNKAPNQHKLHINKEKRRGKTVTLVGEFFLSKEQAHDLLSLLKKRFSCGGSFKKGYMELQGDFSHELKSFLKDEGFAFKS